MMSLTHIWYHRVLPSRFQELLPPSPPWGPGQSSILTHLDTVHTCTNLLQLHADLTVPDITETGRGKEGRGKQVGNLPSGPQPQPLSLAIKSQL